MNTDNPARRFRTQHEADAYTLLHEQGIEAYDAKFGRAGNKTLDEWIDAKLARISHNIEGYTIKTFKKYAHQKVRGNA